MAKRQINDIPNEYSKRLKQDTALSEDGALRYDFMTSLENIAVAKIVTNLWRNQYPKIKTVYHSHTEEFHVAWGLVENNVACRASALPLPAHFTKNLATIVRSIGNSLVKWIQYNNTVIYNKYGCDAVNQMSNIVWTARGKIDYAQTARNILTNRCSTLSDDHKYELACTYCLESAIKDLAPIVANRVYVNNLDFFSDTTNKMVYFWTAKMTDSILDIIFYFLTEDDSNEVALRHVWNQLNEEQKEDNISTFEILRNKEVLFFLLSTLDYEQQQKVLQNCSYIILDEIFDDWLWGEYFVPTALQALSVMDSKSFFNLISNVDAKMNENIDKNTYVYDRCESILKQLWVASARHLKNYIFRNYARFIAEMIFTTSSFMRNIDLIATIIKDLIIYCEPIDFQTLQLMDPFKYLDISTKGVKAMDTSYNGIFKSMYNQYKSIFRQLCIACPWYLRDWFEELSQAEINECIIDYLRSEKIIGLITSIFKALNMQQKTNTIFGYLGVLHWSYLVQSDMWDSYIEWTQFFTEETLKNMLIGRGGEKAYFYFFRQEVLDDINKFISWAFESEAEREEFKRNFAKLYIAVVITFYKNVELRKLDSSLYWFADGNPEMLKIFKHEFPYSTSSKCLIRKFIEGGKYASLNEILSWCFFNNQQKN